jgi:RNA polymerase-binding transcription factor DksA
MLDKRTVSGQATVVSHSDDPEQVFGQKEIVFLRKQLRDRAAVLREEIRTGLIKYDEDQYRAIADRVGDLEERSVADLLTDIDLSEIDRDVIELKDIENALTRIAEGRYGDAESVLKELVEKEPDVAQHQEKLEFVQAFTPTAITWGYREYVRPNAGNMASERYLEYYAALIKEGRLR